MHKVGLWISPFHPSLLEEATGLFFTKKRRQIAVKLWKWFAENSIAHLTEIIRFAVELTDNRELVEYYTRLIIEVEDPWSYEGMLEIKGRLLEKATELGVNLKKVLDDVEYAIGVMKVLGVLFESDEILVYNPSGLVRFLRKIAQEIERG
ncbi:hypothetical protein NF865_02050 [Thermococcus aggregans]|uniref:Uncharacterized protein n=1 Tax=Thermococcus aggregans TaxID=110163 RepID=A0A9E7MY16_THEAG|nr:hypothetical protein [Thermococcus aggregans]USS41024.1 hypothetical protein NF865_02050 [Thermococcus aggregans]